MLGQDLGEAGILGEKAIARMDRLRPGDLAGRDDGRNVEIAVACRRRADAHAFIGKPHMHGIFIGGGMDGHCGNAELAAGTQHAQRYLAPIGDQNLVEHRYSMIMSGSPYSTGWASSTKICVTRPELGAGIWFIVFIASMMRIVCPCFTSWPISTKGPHRAAGER